MKHFALVAFIALCYWLVSNPYNWPVFVQTVAVIKSEAVFNNVSPSRRESAARFLAQDELKLIQLKVLRDSVQ